MCIWNDKKTIRIVGYTSREYSEVMVLAEEEPCGNEERELCSEFAVNTSEP